MYTKRHRHSHVLLYIFPHIHRVLNPTAAILHERAFLDTPHRCLLFWAVRGHMQMQEGDMPWHVHEGSMPSKASSETSASQFLQFSSDQDVCSLVGPHFDPTFKGPAFTSVAKYRDSCNPTAPDRGETCEVRRVFLSMPENYVHVNTFCASQHIILNVHVSCSCQHILCVSTYHVHVHIKCTCQHIFVRANILCTYQHLM